MFLSTLHLGRPWRFYRGFNNLRYSPLSREALGVALFFAMLGGHWLMSLVSLSGLFADWAEITSVLSTISGEIAVVFGAAGIYFMTRIYRIKARPFWNHWQVTASFFGTALSLGGVLAGLGLAASIFILGGEIQGGFEVLLISLATGLALEGLGLIFHARDLQRGGGEGAASFHVQTSQFAGAYVLRNALLGLNLMMVLALWWFDAASLAGMGMAVSVLAMALIGRSLFYVLVIPTTMPGAFFWKNKGFEEHARETGLAEMPQCGVAVKAH